MLESEPAKGAANRNFVHGPSGTIVAAVIKPTSSQHIPTISMYTPAGPPRTTGAALRYSRPATSKPTRTATSLFRSLARGHFAKGRSDVDITLAASAKLRSLPFCWTTLRATSPSDCALQSHLRGAVDNAKTQVARNYKTAIPQFYRGRVQLLLPLCMSHAKHADLAMVVEQHSTFYQASKCLTLDMAYSNARLLAKPDRDWLQP